jgi:hypothetical protein
MYENKFILCDTGTCKGQLRDGSFISMSHHSFDPSSIPSEPIPSKDEEEIQVLMKKIGYDTF